MYWLRKFPEDAMPDEDWRENFRMYTVAVATLLKEQRERAKMVPGCGAPAMDDEAFDVEIRELARQAVFEMPKAELEVLIRKRAIDISGEPTILSANPPEAKGYQPVQSGSSDGRQVRAEPGCILDESDAHRLSTEESDILSGFDTETPKPRRDI
jgi:hypothetical protein